jgi:zinc/manganese transport system permease protein
VDGYGYLQYFAGQKQVNELHMEILLPAMAAGVIILSTHVPLGREVLRRGIIFIDLAIAQISGLGVIAATQIAEDNNIWVVQLSAVTSALLGAALFNWIEKYWPEIQEALIGVFFVLAATASILLLANDPHAGESLKELLVGQILWVNWSQLILPAVLSAIILSIWWLTARSRTSWLFYILFALAITMSVQLVGVYLVFASLIIPALAAYHQNGQKALIIAYAVGVTGYAAGLAGSSLFDLPSGSMIVWGLALSWFAIGTARKIAVPVKP